MYPKKAKRMDFRRESLKFKHKKRVVQLYCRGKTWEEVSYVTGISETMVGKIVHEYYKGRPNTWVLTEKQENLVVKMYLKGHGGSTIAKYFDWPEDVVYRILKRRNIKKRDFSFYREYSLNQDFFEEINSENKAYWLGFLLADGCIKEDRQVLVRLGAKDLNHLKKFQKDLESNYPYFYVDANNTVGVCVGSSKMCRDLAKYGCVMNKTFEIYYPEIPDELAHHFIRGYFDGDGSVHINPEKGRYMFDICGREEFLLDIQDKLISNLGLNKTKLAKTRSIHSIRYGGRHQLMKILNWIYKDSTIYLDRKYESYISFKRNYDGAEFKSGELLETPKAVQTTTKSEKIIVNV